MENPHSWNEVQKAIGEAMREHAQEMKSGVVGASIITAIYLKLKESGFLKEEFCK